MKRACLSQEVPCSKGFIEVGSDKVVDQTGLTGPYDFTLSWGDDSVGGFGGQPDGPTIFTAIQEQLGLRLEAKKVSVDAIGIDRAVRPIFN